MERRTIIILIILGVLVGGYFLVRMILPNNSDSLIPIDTTSQSGTVDNLSADPYQPATDEAKATFPTGSKFLISSNGGTTEISNFFGRAEGYFPELRALLISRTQKYQLVFYRDTAEFSLTISPEALSEDISKIEEELMGILGVGKDSLCNLKINYLSEYDGGGEVIDLGVLPLCASVLK